MTEYSKVVLKEILATKTALLAALELVKEVEALGPIDSIDYETAKPVLVNYGKFAEPPRVRGTAVQGYYSQPGTLTTPEHEYGHKISQWRMYANEAKMLAISPKTGL
jgi:hypothetical protein